MKIQLNLFLLLLIIFYLCYSFSNNVFAVSITNSPDTTNHDSLMDPSNFYYLTDLPLRQVATLLLNDSIYPSDNQITFSCMDSISADIIEARDFYFPVFIKIQDKADGALAEVVGGYLIVYIEKYPKEFAIRINSISDENINSFAQHVGNELYFDNDNINSANKWFTSVLNKCTDCDRNQIQQIEKFNTLILQTIIANNEIGK